MLLASSSEGQVSLRVEHSLSLAIAVQVYGRNQMPARHLATRWRKPLARWPMERQPPCSASRVAPTS